LILVTVGTHTAPFDRLVSAADAYAETVKERVVIQRGVSRYVPHKAISFNFCDSAEMEALIHASRVVVCHAADTVLDALRASRPVVAVPRRRQFGEHLDDHQVDFAKALARLGRVHMLDSPAGLAAAIESAAAMRPGPVPTRPRLATAIRRQIDEWFFTTTS
jgi:exopolysaccharide biosynthesis glucuronosyltransferase PssE